jgi:hypothetical protein
MIDLEVPGEAVRIVQIFRRGVGKQSWTVNRGDAVRSKSRDDETLILLE